MSTPRWLPDEAMLRRVLREELAPIREEIAALREAIDGQHDQAEDDAPVLPPKLTQAERERWSAFAKERPDLIRKSARKGTIRRHVLEGRTPTGRTLESVWEEIRGPGQLHELTAILDGDGDAGEGEA